MINSFKQILDDDEKIVKAFKPNKIKLYFSNFFGFFILLLIAIGIIIAFSISDGIDTTDSLLFALLVLGIWVVLFILDLIILKLYYDKRIYAYTNKRMIIRNGVIGVDYKSLDIDMIGAVDISVNVIDKIINKNTGSIKFGSMARPINPANTNEIFAFTSIENPYEVYKEIKKFMDDTKAKNK